jgi:hypothetical protein
MKRVVSVSLGSSSRDHAAIVELLGQTISIERVGTDGDTQRATALYEELDGNVDCLGVGGAVLSISTSRHSYPLASAQRLVRNVRKTPVVDGDGFKSVMEPRIAATVESEIGTPLARRVLIPSAMDRMGMARSFAEAGYEIIIGDLGFNLGLSIPLRSIPALERVAAAIAPIVRHLPMSMLYPTGTREDVNEPRFKPWFEWASVIAGDCNYITHHMPTDMAGKIVATNTTTQRDIALFRQRGVTHLITSTPRIAGRTFGANVMEAVLVALAGKGRPLDEPEVRGLLDELGWKPNVERLQ